MDKNAVIVLLCLNCVEGVRAASTAPHIMSRDSSCEAYFALPVDSG